MRASTGWSSLLTAAFSRTLIYSATACLVFSVGFCRAMLFIPRQLATRTPSDYETVWIHSDGLRLRAWLGVGRSDLPAFVLVHGLGDSLEGYRDLGDRLHRRGRTVLLLELRAHGGSEGRYPTYGDRECEDVRSALEYVKASGISTKGVVLLGRSLGAVAVLRAAVGRTDVQAVVVEAPFANLSDAAAHVAKHLYGIPPQLPVMPLALAFAQIWADFDARRTDAVEASRRLEVPLFTLLDEDDVWTPEEEVRRVFDAHRGPKRLWVVPGARHADAVFHPDYDRKLMEFLDGD